MSNTQQAALAGRLLCLRFGEGVQVFVHKMIGPNVPYPEVVLKPRWEIIEAALQRLNNRDCSGLILVAGPQDTSLTIFGGKEVWIENSGWDAVYQVVYEVNTISLADESWFLHDPRIPTHYPHEELVLLCCFGQQSEYDADACISRGMALQAVKTFVEKGIRDPSLHWRKDQ